MPPHASPFPFIFTTAFHFCWEHLQILSAPRGSIRALASPYVPASIPTPGPGPADTFHALKVWFKLLPSHVFQSQFIQTRTSQLLDRIPTASPGSRLGVGTCKTSLAYEISTWNKKYQGVCVVERQYLRVRDERHSRRVSSTQRGGSTCPHCCSASRRPRAVLGPAPAWCPQPGTTSPTSSGWLCPAVLEHDNPSPDTGMRSHVPRLQGIGRQCHRSCVALSLGAVAMGPVLCRTAWPPRLRVVLVCSACSPKAGMGTLSKPPVTALHGASWQSFLVGEHCSALCLGSGSACSCNSEWAGLLATKLEFEINIPHCVDTTWIIHNSYELG